ncbi:hypothetical protein FXO38_20526 [Capsicum annuum]|nr:hypothetical protein FXO38_20526 [Capsicum annuum]
MHYLRKKYKNKNFSTKRYTTTDCFFKVYIDKAYMNYYNADVGKEILTQDPSARTDEVADMEMLLINTIKGLSTHVGQPWHLVNEVFVPINCDAVYAEYLSEELGIPSSGINTQYHRLRYASLLCKYRSEKVENDYFSENDDPPWPRSKFAPKETNCVLHIQ